MKWHAATSRLPQPCKHHPNAWWSKVHVHLMWLKHIDPFSNSIFLLSGGNLVFHVGCLDWMDRFHLLIPKREISHLRRVARSNVFFRSLDWFMRITQETNKNKKVNLKNSNAVNSPARTLWLHLAEIKLRLYWHDYMFGKQFLRSAANEISQGCFCFFSLFLRRWLAGGRVRGWGSGHWRDLVIVRKHWLKWNLDNVGPLKTWGWLFRNFSQV